MIYFNWIHVLYTYYFLNNYIASFNEVSTYLLTNITQWSFLYDSNKHLSDKNNCWYNIEKWDWWYVLL